MKLSINLKITSISPSHIHFKLFSNMIPDELDHVSATRASLGDHQCLQTDEFGPFVRRLAPDLVSMSADVRLSDLYEYTDLRLSLIQLEDYYGPTYYWVEQ